MITFDYNGRPGTTEPVPKESYVVKVGNQGCGVGFYNSRALRELLALKAIFVLHLRRDQRP
jgi:hypothetical protein